MLGKASIGRIMTFFAHVTVIIFLYLLNALSVYFENLSIVIKNLRILRMSYLWRVSYAQS